MGLNPHGGSLSAMTVCSNSMWCADFTVDLVCLIKQVSRVLSSGLNLFRGSFIGRLMVDVDVFIKYTLLTASSFCESSIGEISCSEVVVWLSDGDTGRLRNAVVSFVLSIQLC